MHEISWFKIKSAESAIPKAWVLERSIDGETYEPWQFFAVDEDDCQARFGLPASNANDIFKNEREIICSTEFSGSKRLKYGEAKFVVLDQRPSEAVSPELLNFTLARFVRIRLQGKRTLKSPSLTD